MNPNLKLFVFILAIIIALHIPNLTFALSEKTDVQSEAVNPGLFFYKFKRLGEKFTEFITFSKRDQNKLHLELLKKRIAEMAYVSQNNFLSEFQNASERISFEAGKSIAYTDQLTDFDKKQIITSFQGYKTILEKIRDKYSANSSFWLFIQQNIDTFDILSNKIK